MSDTSGDDRRRTAAAPDTAPAPHVPAQRSGRPRTAPVPPWPATAHHPVALLRPAPAHAAATTSMVLGILALALSPGFGLSLLVSPVAWWLGRHSLSEIDAAESRWSGRAMAQAGMVLGIVGSVLLAIAVLAVVAMLVFLFRYDGSRM